MLYPFIIEPNTFTPFEDEADQIAICKQWGLLSEKASKIKAFFYKGNGVNLPCSIIGYVDKVTAVIAFDNDQQHCIHPSYLKEMQASSYGQKQAAAVEEVAGTEHTAFEEPLVAQTSNEDEDEDVTPKEAPKRKEKKEKAPKLQLPEEKVKMTATVLEFTTVPNNFSDNEDEVVIYEAVAITEPDALEIGTAWSSHSATLKKLELEVGDIITFEGKIVAKKLTKHPVPYKINNPAKLQKTKNPNN